MPFIHMHNLICPSQSLRPHGRPLAHSIRERLPGPNLSRASNLYRERRVTFLGTANDFKRGIHRLRDNLGSEATQIECDADGAYNFNPADPKTTGYLISFASLSADQIVINPIKRERFSVVAVLDYLKVQPYTSLNGDRFHLRGRVSLANKEALKKIKSELQASKGNIHPFPATWMICYYSFNYQRFLSAIPATDHPVILNELLVEEQPARDLLFPPNYPFEVSLMKCL